MARNEEKYARRRLKTAYASTVVSISLVLYLLGLLGVLLLQANKLSRHVKENISISIFLHEDEKEADIMQLQKTIDTKPYARTTEYIPKDVAAEELKKELGEDFIAFLGYNPLLSSIEIYLQAPYANEDSMVKIENQLLKNSQIKEVYYQKSLVHLVNENIKKIGYIIVGFSVLLLIISIALINNTIRLSVYSKRFIIKSMQLLGATQRFIRKPFVIKGVFQGIIGAVISLILLNLTLYFGQKQLPELGELQDIKLYIAMTGIVVFSGIIIAWISTYFAVRKYLKIKTDNLYYF